MNIENASAPENVTTDSSIKQEEHFSDSLKQRTKPMQAFGMDKQNLKVEIPNESSFTPNGSVGLFLYRPKSENPYKVYKKIPEASTETEENKCEQCKVFLNLDKFRLDEISKLVSAKIQRFLPMFVSYLAYKASLKTLHSVKMAIARRENDLARGQVVDKTKTYYQNLSGTRWYWCVKWTDEKGIKQNNSLCRCEGLNLPPVEKNRKETINPHTANWAFSNRYLVELSEQIISREIAK
jgi:hypothetical protein